MTDVVCVSTLAQVPLSVCSNFCPPGTRKAIRPNFPICCHDCVVCAAGEISNQTGEKMLFALITAYKKSHSIAVKAFLCFL